MSNLSKYTVAQLKSLAAKNNVALPLAAKKADIILTLQNHSVSTPVKKAPKKTAKKASKKAPKKAVKKTPSGQVAVVMLDRRAREMDAQVQLVDSDKIAARKISKISGIELNEVEDAMLGGVGIQDSDNIYYFVVKPSNFLG